MKRFISKISLVLVVILCLSMIGCGSGSVSDPSESSPKANAEPVKGSKFPSHNLTLVVPYGAGSSVDISGRAIQPALQDAIGQTVVVENREGGSGAVGFTYLANLDDSGYAFGIANIASICTNAVLGDLELDPREAYYFLGNTVTDPFLVLVSAESSFNTLQDLIDYATEHPGEVTYGATGAMSMDTMTGYDIEAAGDCDLNIVSFSSGSDVIAGILGGHVQACGSSLSEGLPYIQDGSLKCIGIGGDSRAPEIPDVPTYAEQGINMTFQMAKRAVFLPANTSQDALDVLVPALKAAIESESYKEACATLSLQPMYLDPEACMEECTNVMEFLEENRDSLIGG